MNWQSDCAAIVPCLNERAAIAPLVTAIRTHLPGVLVIDDGSTDGTAAVAQQAGAEVIRHKQSQGKGAALHTGLQRARELGFTWTLTMDGDGQHSAEDIPAFLSCAERSASELVVGNRMNNSDRMPRLRRF